MRYRNLDGFRTKINNRHIDAITIILEDDRGRKIDVNTHWELCLELNKVVNTNFPNLPNNDNKADVQDIENF